MKRKNAKGPPLSGDKLVDLLFKLLLEAMNYRIISIKNKKNITNPDKKSPREKRATVYGIYDPETREIFLNTSKCKHPTRISMVPSLIHEVFHEIMPNVFHKRIYQLENILQVRFTDEQKKYLKRFIPRHEVKKGPAPSN